METTEADLYKVQNIVTGEWVYLSVDLETNDIHMELNPILRWFGISENDIIDGDFIDCIIPEGSAQMVCITSLKITGCTRTPERDRHMAWINAIGNQFGANCRCGARKYDAR